MLECKFCGSEMEMIDSWPVYNEYGPIAPAFRAYFSCSDPKCDSGYNSEIERWSPPDLHAETEEEETCILP